MIRAVWALQKTAPEATGAYGFAFSKLIHKKSKDKEIYEGMENNGAIFWHKIGITDLILMKIATHNFKRTESWV